MNELIELANEMAYEASRNGYAVMAGTLKGFVDTATERGLVSDAIPVRLTNLLSNAYAEIREQQRKMPTEGDILLRQQLGRICSAIDDFFDTLEETRLAGGEKDE